MALEIQREINNGQMEVKLVGSLDALAAAEFDKDFSVLPDDAAVIELDFSAVSYISSAGLRSLLKAKKLAAGQGKRLLVKDPQHAVEEVFDVTGFDSLLEIVYSKQPKEQVDVPADGYYPLRPVQAWLVDTHFYKADSTMMNNGALLKLDESIDMERLAGAFNGLLADYDIFRCRLCFHPDTGEICQRFDGAVSNVVVEMLSEEAFNQRKLELKKPYKLINSPLYRIYLMVTPSGKYFYADFYHAIMDGTAIVILFWREIVKRYLGKNVSGKHSSYAEYVMEEARILSEGQEEAHLYWQKVLAGFDPEKHLPPVDVEHQEAWHQGNVEHALRNIGQSFFHGKKSYSENTFFLAAAMIAMAKITGHNDVIMSWVHNARTTMREMRIMGLMLNQFPIRWDFDNEIKTGQFLAELEERVNKGISYAKGLDEVYRNDLEGDCATFILQKNTDINAAYVIDGHPCQIVEMPANKWSAAENVLDIAVSALDDGSYYLTLTFDGGRYTNENMERYAAAFDDVLAVLQKEDCSVGEILA